MPSDLILQAVAEFGPPHARRYVIVKLDTREYFTGDGFSIDSDQARLYATTTSAGFEMHDILRAHYAEKPLKRYRVPIEVEVFGDVSMAQVARWLSQASLLNIRTHVYGNGPRNSLVLPVIHWGLIKDQKGPMFSLDEINIDEEEDDDANEK